MLHGFPLGSGMWTEVATRLSQQARVLVPDLRGHGASPAPPGTYEMDELADDVHDLVRQQGIATGFYLAGLSMGGYVALAYVARYAGQLQGLILCDTRASADSAEAAENRRRMAHQIDNTASIQHVVDAYLPKLLAADTYARRPELVQRVRAMMEAQPPAGVAACLRGMANRPDRTPMLSSIRVPTLVVVGSNDQVTPPDEARLMARSIPGAVLSVIEEAGHLPSQEDPDGLAAIMGRFLNVQRS
jgi:pimeloyl-ACP methyl ester carboxylesterase